MNKRQQQLLEKQRKMYNSLTEYQLGVINEYFKDNMRKLRKICDPLICQRNIPDVYYEDLYAVASDTLIESLYNFDETKECLFTTFLTGNIGRAFSDWTRDNTRLCRCNILTDRDGKIVRDEKGNVTIIPNLSLDAQTEDGVDIAEKIAYDFNMADDTYSPVVKEYLQSLSNLQSRILEMINQGYNREEIVDILNISLPLYKDSIDAITSRRRTRRIRRLLRGYRNVG